MPEQSFRMRPLRVGEVAQVAGDPRETIRTREKQGVYGFERAAGWKRYTDLETIAISIHSRIKKATGNDELAKLGMLISINFLDGEAEVVEGTSYFRWESLGNERVLFFWEDGKGGWNAELCQSATEVVSKVETLLQRSNENTPVFSVVNLRTLIRDTVKAMIEVQSE